jgi:hypothetical protein
MDPQDMDPQDMDPQDMDPFTTIIDNLNYNNNKTITTEDIYEIFWPHFQRLLKTPNKEALVKDWKYETQFIATEKSHANNCKDFDHLDWEHSFVLAFWMCIYH